VYQLTAESGYIHYVSIVVHQSDVDTLQLDGQALGISSSSWLNVDSPSDWVTAAVSLAPASAPYTLQHAGQRHFGAYRYSYIRSHCAFAHPAGASLPLPVHTHTHTHTRPSVSTFHSSF